MDDRQRSRTVCHHHPQCVFHPQTLLYSLKNYLLLLISILLLSTPSTGFAFIQLIYSKRILILLFSIYILFYLRYQPSKEIGERNITLATALVRIFVIDVDILLFVTSTINQLDVGSFGQLQFYPKLQ